MVSSTNVGFIGLGNMGMIMAKKLAENRVPLTVYDLRDEAIREMVRLGAAAAASCHEVAEKSDVIKAWYVTYPRLTRFSLENTVSGKA